VTRQLSIVHRSVLESADQALRHKPRQPSVMSSVVKSPPLKSSVQKIGGSESAQSLTLEQSTSDVRTVVHTSSKLEKRHHPSSSREKHSTQRSAADRNAARSSEQLLITVTDDDRRAMANDDQRALCRSAVDDRKVSILDEDQFEPDYDETDTAAETSTGEGGKRSRHKHSRRSSGHSEKSKKHKKHRKKSKKHKSKSKKLEKL